ncbi:MAG: GNAT family N-acetyltransferase [Hyphomicrobiaceae bacterium]
MADVVRLASLTERREAEGEVERIFFAASGTKAFACEAAREAFRERWLGRYLTHDAQHVFVALDAARRVVGYLVGSLDDPARTARFGDIGFFADFAPLTARYQAHLHVNLDESARGSGIGGLLVEAFCGDVRAAGLPGVHVVTGKGVRNVAFYERLGFLERGAAVFNGHDIVFLGRDLSR